MEYKDVVYMLMQTQKKGESITILLCFNVGVDGFEPPTLCL